LAGRELPAARLAALLQSAERRFVGTPCGIMDMMTAIVGRPSCALRLDCRSLRFEAIPLPASITMLLVDTGVRHALGSSDYGRRRAEVEQASAALGVSSLRDADLELVERAALPDALRRRARHVVREIARVDRAVAALRSDDAAELGRIVSASHASLRDDFDVSVPEVDRVVELALRADPGVLGARMVGGGFGGAVLVVASSSRVDHVERSLRELGLAAPPHSIRRVRPGAGYTASVVEELPS
ncbi:MAG: galactokinase, partial [Phycisphaerae bacterium]|nr:galactokinase [Phycisphaerae bacterium]